MEKILYLTLHKQWFIDILKGKKKVEYREKKSYWKQRLLDKKGKTKKYDYIIFKNGYNKKAPTMKIEYKGIKITDQYEIQLGKIKETKNVTEEYTNS